MIRSAFAALLLTGCAHAPPLARVSMVMPPIPPVLRHCSTGAREPTPPPAPRTIEQVVRWAVATETAREHTERALEDCAYRLARLNQWIEDHGQ